MYGSLITTLEVNLEKLDKGFDEALKRARKYRAEIDKLSKVTLSSGMAGGAARGATGATGRAGGILGLSSDAQSRLNDLRQVRDFHKYLQNIDATAKRAEIQKQEQHARTINQVETQLSRDRVRIRNDVQKYYDQKSQESIKTAQREATAVSRIEEQLAKDRQRIRAEVQKNYDALDAQGVKNRKQILDQASKEFEASEKQRENAIKEAIREIEAAEKSRLKVAAFDATQSPLAPSQRMPGGIRRIVQEFREDLGKSPSLVSRLTASFQNLHRQALVPMQKTWEKFSDSLKHTIGPAIGISGVVGIGAFVGYAVKLNREYQTQKIALGEVLALTTKVIDRTGKEIEQRREINFNLKESSALIEKVRAESFRTVLRAPELVRVFQQTLGFAVRTGFKPEQAIRPIAQIANLAKSLGARDEREVQFEERSLFTGRNVARGRIGQILGLTKADVQNAQHAGTFIEFLNKVLQAGQPYMDRYARSFEGITTTLQTKFQLLTQLSTEKTFEKITSRLVSLNQQLTRQKISDFAERISSGVTHAYDAIEHFAKSDALKGLGNFFKLLINNAPTLISVLAAFKTFQGIKKIGGAIPGPVGAGIQLGGLATAGLEAYFGPEIIKNQASAAAAGFGTEALRKRTGERFANAKRQLDELQRQRGEQQEIVNGIRAQINMYNTGRTPGLIQRGPMPAEAEKLPDKLMIEQNKLVDINDKVLDQEAHAKRAGEEDRKQKAKDAATDRELRRVSREFNSKEAIDNREKIAFDKIFGREKKEQINAIHAALDAEILTAKKRITTQSLQQRAIHELVRQAHNKRVALEDEDKIATIQNQGEIAENRGKTIQKLLLDDKEYRAEKLKLLHQENISEAEFQKLTQTHTADTNKKIVQQRQDAFTSLKQLQLREVDLARDTADKRKNILREILDAERSYAKEQRQFIKERRDAEHSLTEALRSEKEARQNLEFGGATRQERDAFRKFAAKEQEQTHVLITGEPGRETEGEFTAHAPTIREQLEKHYRRNVGSEFRDLDRGDQLLLTTQKVTDEIRSLSDMIVGPDGFNKTVERLKELGINLTLGQRKELAGFGARATITRQTREGVEEARTAEGEQRAATDATRAVTDAQDHLKEVNQRAAEAAQAYTERQTKLQAELTSASREYQRALLDLRKESEKVAEAFRGIGGGRPAAIDAAFSMPAFSRLGGGSSKFVGVGLPRGIAGPPTPLELMPGMQNIRERVMGGFETFRRAGPINAASAFGAPLTGLGELQQRAAATGVINVGGEADRIIGDLFPDTKKNRVSSLPGVNLQGQTVSKETAEMYLKSVGQTTAEERKEAATNNHFHLEGMKLGEDTKETMKKLGTQLQRDARRTP